MSSVQVISELFSCDVACCPFNRVDDISVNIILTTLLSQLVLHFTTLTRTSFNFLTDPSKTLWILLTINYSHKNGYE
jgi:hypothetical protein